jgi:arylsulfatase A
VKRRTTSLARRSALKLSGVSIASLALSRFVDAKSQPQKSKPNVILFFTDDQGWCDTSVQMAPGIPESKSDYYQTPVLEKMARRGMIFSNAYSPAPVCTPSRGSVQFGKTPARLKQTVIHDVLAKSRGIDCKNEISIAELVKTADANYVTAHFGKWGFPPRSPQDCGYDVSDGDTNNGDGDWSYGKKRQRTPLPKDDPKRIFSITGRANTFMTKCAKASKPFYMQLSHYAVHVQHFARPETIRKYLKATPGAKCNSEDFADPPPKRNAWAPLYGAMIEDMDTALGMIFDKLEQLGLADNTYVIFTSDNGGGFRGNKPLRGGKANLWEGGLRVPTVICGPGVKAGAYCNQPIAGWDFHPTIADLIGNTKPLPKGLDGGSIRPLLSDPKNGKVKRDVEGFVFHFPWYAGTPISAIRVGDYKLMLHLNTGETRLYNLTEDLGEENDLAKQMPKLAKKLEGQLKAYLKNVDAENILDMRAARRAELLEYQARTQRDTAKIHKAISNAKTDAQRELLNQKLLRVQKQIKGHKNGLKQLAESTNAKNW